MDWQTLVALSIVTLTVTIFLVRLANKKKSSCGCGQQGHSCSNSSKKDSA